MLEIEWSEKTGLWTLRHDGTEGFSFAWAERIRLLLQEQVVYVQGFFGPDLVFVACSREEAIRIPGIELEEGKLIELGSLTICKICGTKTQPLSGFLPYCSERCQTLDGELHVLRAGE